MRLKKTEAVTNTIRSLNMLRESYNTEKTCISSPSFLYHISVNDSHF